MLTEYRAKIQERLETIRDIPTLENVLTNEGPRNFREIFGQTYRDGRRDDFTSSAYEHRLLVAEVSTGIPCRINKTNIPSDNPSVFYGTGCRCGDCGTRDDMKELYGNHAIYPSFLSNHRILLIEESTEQIKDLIDRVARVVEPKGKSQEEIVREVKQKYFVI